MVPSSLEVVSEGCVKLHGELTFNTIMSLLIQAEQVLQAYSPTTFDLSAVTQSDSAGLALLVEWLRKARQKGQTIIFKNIPAQLASIMKVCDLTGILPIREQ